MQNRMGSRTSPVLFGTGAVSPEERASQAMRSDRDTVTVIAVLRIDSASAAEIQCMYTLAALQGRTAHRVPGNRPASKGLVRHNGRQETRPAFAIKELAKKRSGQLRE